MQYSKKNHEDAMNILAKLEKDLHINKEEYENLIDSNKQLGDNKVVQRVINQVKGIELLEE